MTKKSSRNGPQSLLLLLLLTWWRWEADRMCVQKWYWCWCYHNFWNRRTSNGLSPHFRSAKGQWKWALTEAAPREIGAHFLQEQQMKVRSEKWNCNETAMSSPRHCQHLQGHCLHSVPILCEEDLESLSLLYPAFRKLMMKKRLFQFVMPIVLIVRTRRQLVLAQEKQAKIVCVFE